MNALAPLEYPGQRYRIATDAPLGLAPPGDLRREYFAGHIPPQEQYRPYFGTGLDMPSIERAILSANFGRMHLMTDLARETIFLDGHVNALLQKRLNRLGALDWQLTPASGPGLDETRAKERCEEVRENLAMMPNFRERLIDLAWGNFDGRAASEIEWYRWGRSWRARDLHWIHPRRLCFGPDRDIRVQDPMRQTGNFQDVGCPIEFIPFKFLVFKPRMFGDYQEREGLAPRTLYWSFFPRIAKRAQLQLMEIFGAPWRIMMPKQGMPGVIPGAGNVDLYEAGFQALINLGYQNTARMPPGVEVQIVQPEEGAGQVHKDVITDCRDVLTKMYLGGVATTEAVSTGLGSNIGNVHLSEEDLIIASDARRISECVEDQLTDAIVVVNYGPAEAAYAPKFAIRTDPPVDRTEEITRLGAALNVGLRIAEEEARERSGYRPVRDDEPYLVRFQRPADSGQVAPPPAPEVVWPPGQAPVTGEVPAVPDVAINLPDGPSGAPAPGTGGGIPVPGNGALPGAPAVPALPAPKTGDLPGSGAPGSPGDPGHKLPPGGGGTSDDGQATLSAGDDAPDEDIARLAAKMTELGIERCAHEKVNRCWICGIERVRDVTKGDDGVPVWSVAWKPIGVASTRAVAPAPASAPPVADAGAGSPAQPAADLAEPGDDPKELLELEAELEQEEPDENEMRTARDLGIEVEYFRDARGGIVDGDLHRAVRGSQLLGARKQPPTAFGSPDDLIERGTAAFAAQAGKFAEAIAKRVDGLSSGKAIDAAIKRAAKAWKPARFVAALAPELEHAQWLGALDADFEAKTGHPVKVETFTELWSNIILARAQAILRNDPANDAGADPDPAFAKRPQIDAGESFIEREVVTRDVFDEMALAAKRRAFTVANAATKEMARAVKRELVRQVALGADLADFKTHAVKRLESAGWTPLNSSHAETVLRTNVMGAYNSGRYRQMAQPKVVALRPYWQILGVGDDRQRTTHHEIQNKVFRADDPIFKTAYPPFGYNCRCRARSLSKAQAENVGISSGSTYDDKLPDKGFASGIDNLLDVPKVPNPEEAANDVAAEAANDTSEGGDE